MKYFLTAVLQSFLSHYQETQLEMDKSYISYHFIRKRTLSSNGYYVRIEN